MNWSYFLVFALFACGPTKPTNEGKLIEPADKGIDWLADPNSGDQTGKNDHRREIYYKTGTSGTGTAQGEVLLSELARNEIGLLTTELLKHTTVKIPPIWQKRMDNLNKLIKPPIWWVARRDVDGDMLMALDRLYNKQYPEIYASGTGNDDHLSGSPAFTMYPGKPGEFNCDPGIAVSDYGKSASGKIAVMTYDAVDYFANPKCPATITGMQHKPNKHSGGYLQVKFPNGNEIKIGGSHNKGIGLYRLNFWVGRDGNLKMSYTSSIMLSDSVQKFATFAECGVRIPELDYEVKHSEVAGRSLDDTR